MAVSYDSINDVVVVSSSRMLDFYNNNLLYNEVDVILKYNNNSEVTITFDQVNPITTTGDVYISGNDTIIKPAALGLDTFEEGIYKITFVFKSDSIFTEHYCLAILKDIKCKVYEFSISDAKADLKNKIATIYMLLNTSDLCPCECDALIDLYLYMVDVVTKDCISC